jgi:hypothetical protein
MEEQNKYAKPIFLSFGKTWEQPEFKYNKSQGYIGWGKDNDYPNQILSLYNEKGSGLHKAIVNRKINLISGQGIVTQDAQFAQWLLDNMADEVLIKVVTDFEIFDAFAIEINIAS